MEQIDILANFIMGEIEGEPNRSEGAGDCAIRIIRKQEAELDRVAQYVRAYTKAKPLPDDSIIPLSLHNTYRALSDKTRARIEEE